MQKTISKLNRVIATNMSKLLLSLLVLLALPFSAHAAGAGAEPAGLSTLLFPAINFSLYCLILGWIYKSKIASAMRAKSAEVVEAIAVSVRELETARAQLADSKRKLSQFDDEKTRELKRLEQETESLALKVIEDADKSSISIKSDSQRRAADLFVRAEGDVRREIISSALSKAKKEVGSGLTEDIDQKLRQETILRIGN